MTSLGAEAPFIMFDRGPDGPAALFDELEEVIEAWAAEDAAAAFARLEAALSSGRWIAGAAAYELGYVLEPALRALLPPTRNAPLLRFGVFKEPKAACSIQDRAAKEEAGAAMRAAKPIWPLVRYEAAFAEAIEQIRAGDYYQINLTHPLAVTATGSFLGLHRLLRRAQPAAYGALDALGAPVLLSRSPELFFEAGEDGSIETRPMKGTAPRGGSAAEDDALKAALAMDEKNRAENLMIVDLLRNDLGRIAEIGSVEVPDLFRVETYATVHQMISRVQAQLLPGVGLRRLFEALFPCGSVTGAPKIAAMQAIRRLEPWPREAYCGAIGWAAPRGESGFSRMRFNVAIRTLSLSPDPTAPENTWNGVLNVGGGLVADSTAAGEYEESLWKARFATGLLRATTTPA